VGHLVSSSVSTYTGAAPQQTILHLFNGQIINTQLVNARTIQP
jgi:hypothetical protein